MTAPGENRLSAIADDLATKGWSWQPGLLPETLTHALREELVARDAEADLEAAGIGREGEFQVDRSIRRTRITWFDGTTSAQKDFQIWSEGLRASLNRDLMLGLFDMEVCFAVYPPGGFYDRHLDSFAGARNRVISLVAYLNEDWDEARGGALAVWNEGASDEDAPVARIIPEPGGVMLMLSEAIPHAVEVTREKRLGLAGWWRVNQSGMDRIDPLS
ncbi:2OG-Fe(II) oxygenase [Henriciella sp.]|uniref:2OG-Fe(II) oxygenase n=1 Tax=Henriciella sp. TaxID=1968823 RepID=UPI00260C4226|nr:2OG-Fe(II) oxygenase [Henriciella sp.]